MGRGSRPRVRWRNDRNRKFKERAKRRAANKKTAAQVAPEGGGEQTPQ